MSTATATSTTTVTTTTVHHRDGHSGHNGHNGHNDYHQHEGESKPFSLDRVQLPHYGSHVQAGNGIATDGNVLLFQDGSTTLEFRTLSHFESKRVPWRHGLIRDIVYSPRFDRFILLTRDAVYSISAKPLVETGRVKNMKPLVEFPVSKFEGIQPFDDRHLFWRCTTVGKTLYVIYAGRGTVMEEYTLSSSSCKLVNRWQPPKTCKPDEGVWCIRYHPDSDQLGFTIMDSHTKQWRFEVRNRENLHTLWSIALPLTRGDAEISIIPNEQWLIVNVFGLQFAQISKHGMSAMIDYDSELRGAVVIDDAFFIVRTKNTLDTHRLDLLP